MSASTSPSGYVYPSGATNVNPFWEQSDNPVQYLKNIELVDDRENTGRYILRFTDQDGAGHTAGYIGGFYTDIRATQTENSVSIYGTKDGVESLIISFSKSGGGSGGITEEEVREIVTGYGYQNQQQVEDIVEGYGYQTQQQVSDAIDEAIYGALQEPY